MYDINLGLAPYLIVLLLAVANEGGNLLVLFCGQEPEVGAPPAPGVQNLNSDVIHHYSILRLHHSYPPCFRLVVLWLQRPFQNTTFMGFNKKN